MLFHDQHPYAPGEEDLADGFLRLGVELPGGERASNIGGHRPLRRSRPGGTCLIDRGGGGGSGRHDRVPMDDDHWIWPVPEPGTIRVACEWPVVEILLSTVEIDGGELVAATERVVPVWPSA